MKQKNMNKHGFFLAEETLKIILAVIVIGFLIYFLVSLYFSNADEENMQFAESSAKYIIEQMNAQTEEIQIFNPEGWIIISWKTEEEMPMQCSNLGWKNCTCICEDDINSDIPFFENTDLDDCNEESYCFEYSKEIFINEGSLKIDNPPITLEINYGDKIEVKKK